MLTIDIPEKPTQKAESETHSAQKKGQLVREAGSEEGQVRLVQKAAFDETKYTDKDYDIMLTLNASKGWLK
jgi:hypothetical protein